jgi:hypothetical protein
MGNCINQYQSGFLTPANGLALNLTMEQAET